LRRPARAPLFPYTTLFRSLNSEVVVDFRRRGSCPGERSPLEQRWTSHHKIERLPRRSLNLRPGTERLSTPCLQARLRVVRDSKRSEEHTSELQSRSDLVCR